jgi:hypothetical protein
MLRMRPIQLDRNAFQGNQQSQTAELSAVRDLLRRKTLNNNGLANALRAFLAEYSDDCTVPKVLNARAALRHV